MQKSTAAVKLIVSSCLFFASVFFGGKAWSAEDLSLQVQFPNGGAVSCPLKTARTTVLFFFHQSSLDDNPSEACRTLIEQLEHQQTVSDLRSLVFHMRGRTQEEYEKALADFLLGKLGVSSAAIAQIRVTLAPDFFEWSDAEAIKYLNEQYDLTTRRLQRINDLRRRNPGALKGS